MAFNIEVTFVDAVTTVDASWLNLLQEHLAGLATIEIDSPTATQVRLLAGSDDDVASIYIGGQQRRRDTNAVWEFTGEQSGTYSIYVTATDGLDTFELEVKNSPPLVIPFRQIGTVEWNGAAIIQIRTTVGRRVTHDHSDLDGAGEIAHSDLLNLGGDEHTQYAKIDGTRAYTGSVVGVTPSADTDLATKGYIDGIAVPGLPVGVIVPFGGESVPGGWKLCDGASYDTGAEAAMFAVLGYVYGGSGSNFDVPDLRKRLPLGKAVSGTGSALADTGGSLDHDHSQASHTHTASGTHTHSIASHNHTFPTSGVNSTHNHTQGSTGSQASHTHAGPSHSHSDGGYVVGTSSVEEHQTQHQGNSTPGLYGENHLDEFASSGIAHSHGDGTLDSPLNGDICGSSASTSPSHTHVPAGNSWEHKHTGWAVTGSTASSGTGNSGSGGSHTHTNPTVSTTGSHSHSGGTSGSTSPSTNSGGGGAVASAGGADSDRNAPPHLVMNYIVRAS